MEMREERETRRHVMLCEKPCSTVSREGTPGSLSMGLLWKSRKESWSSDHGRKECGGISLPWSHHLYPRSVFAPQGASSLNYPVLHNCPGSHHPCPTARDLIQVPKWRASRSKWGTSQETNKVTEQPKKIERCGSRIVTFLVPF